MVGTFNPCYGCEDRHDLCHADCEAYLDFRHKKNLENAARAEKISINYALAQLHRHGASSRKQRRKQ